MNPRDKMPFEVTPIFFKLNRYDAAAAAAALNPAPAPAGADPNAAPPAGDPNAVPAGGVDQNAQPPAGQPAPDNTAPPATPQPQ
jgi:hypothetical protein